MMCDHSMVSRRVSSCVSHSLSCMFTALLLSLMSKLKKCKNEHEEQEKKNKTKTLTLCSWRQQRKCPFFGRMEELFPFFFPLHFLNIVDSLLPLCVVAFFCYKRGLKKEQKRGSCRVSSVQFSGRAGGGGGVR